MKTKLIQIAHYIYKFDLQGNFLHWGDGVMVTETFWFAPNMHRTKYISKKTQTLSTNLITEQLDSDLWKNKQPDASLLKNCTVAKIYADPVVGMKWYAVPCDQTFFATFMCFVPRTISDDVTNRVANSELAGEPGWFHWIVHTECYAVKTLPVIVNFTAVKQFCSLSNSSLLNLHEISRSVATIEEEKHIMQLWYQHLRPSFRQHAHYFKIVNDIFSRMIVEKKSLLSLFEFLKLYIHTDLTDLIEQFNLQYYVSSSSKPPDHSVLWINLSLPGYSQRVDEPVRRDQPPDHLSQNNTDNINSRHFTKFMYNGDKHEFMNNNSWLSKTQEILDHIKILETQCDVDKMNDNLCTHIFSELDIFYKK